MSASIAKLLLQEAGALGVELRVQAGSIQVRPRAALPESLAERLRAHRTDVLALLEARADPLVAAVLDGFDGELVDDSPWADVALFREPPKDAEECRACGGRRWWRLGSGPAVCERCHPCIYSEGVERWTAGEGGAS